VAFALVGACTPSFAGIVYTMTNASGIQDGWELSGTITASGTGTGLGSSDITSWAWTVTKGLDSYTFTSNDTGAGVNAYGLLATPTALIVPYTPEFSSDSLNYLDIVTRSGLDRVYWGTGGGVDGDLANYSAVSSPINFWYIQTKNPDFFPSRTADGWVVGTASAPVPEIDPATGSSALSLVAGVLAMIEQRRRRGLKAGLAG